MLLHPIRCQVHVIQRVRHVRMTIVTTDIVHPVTVFSIRFLNGGVPLFWRNTIVTGNAYAERARGRPKRHSSIIANIIGASKIAHDALAVGDSRVTNERNQPGNGRER